MGSRRNGAPAGDARLAGKPSSGYSRGTAPEGPRPLPRVRSLPGPTPAPRTPMELAPARPALEDGSAPRVGPLAEPRPPGGRGASVAHRAGVAAPAAAGRSVGIPGAHVHEVRLLGCAVAPGLRPQVLSYEGKLPTRCLFGAAEGADGVGCCVGVPGRRCTDPRTRADQGAGRPEHGPTGPGDNRTGAAGTRADRGRPGGHGGGRLGFPRPVPMTTDRIPGGDPGSPRPVGRE